MTFDRGFKAWCERTAVGIRRSLDLEPWDPLDAATLAEHLGIELLTPRDVAGLTAEELDQLLKHDRWGWSAVTVATDSQPIVIYNPLKSAGRRASDIMHELAHVILSHQPGTIILSQDGDMGMRSFDKKQEDEANWLAWCLLLPREALVQALRRRLNKEQIAAAYGVTTVLVQFRIGKTGVQAQFKRLAARRVGRSPSGRSTAHDPRS